MKRPKSHLPQCVACLYRIGWGIKRIVRHTGFAKTSVHRFARAHGLIDPTTAERKRRAYARQPKPWKRINPQVVKKEAARLAAAARKTERASRPKRTAMDRYYANHEESKRRSRENAKKLYLRTPKGSNLHLRRLLRSRICNAIVRQSADTSRTDRKAMPTMQLVGCTVAQLRAHLERQFKPGMTWDNLGAWHIDHIKPCASFDLSDPDQQRACFHYTNLQPLWARENLSKSDRIAA